MASTEEASALDLAMLGNHFKSINLAKHGGKVLDLCGGIGRCGLLLSKHYEIIDIMDLQPGWGAIKNKKRGKLIRGSL